MQNAIGQFREYFAGQRREFDLPLDWPRLEPMTEAVLRTLMGVGYGETVTYAELARAQRDRRPGAGHRLDHGREPLPIVVPCHRVVASDGLGGYSGGEPGHEIETKRWLLENEGPARDANLMRPELARGLSLPPSTAHDPLDAQAHWPMPPSQARPQLQVHALESGRGPAAASRGQVLGAPGCG